MPDLRSGAHRRPHTEAEGARAALRTFSRRIAVLFVLVLVMLAIGTVGLVLSEGVGAWYAFRWTLDTAATVGGFGQPASLAGQIVHVFLIVVGVGTLFYALAALTELFVAGHLGDVLAARRAQRMIDSLSGHHIICGFGRVGRQVARDLVAAHEHVVVIDADSSMRERAEGMGLGFIDGDATDDAVLLAAGIERARSLIACADSDANNIFMTLTARELRADLSIVARSAVEDTEKKLRRAGADRVISPYKASGTEMARLAMHPQLSSAVDVDESYRLEEIVVPTGVEGAKLGEVRGGAMVVGVRRGGAFHPQPDADATLHSGDVLVAIGTQVTLEQLEAAVTTGDASAA